MKKKSIFFWMVWFIKKNIERKKVLKRIVRISFCHLCVVLEITSTTKIMKKPNLRALWDWFLSMDNKSGGLILWVLAKERVFTKQEKLLDLSRLTIQILANLVFCELFLFPAWASPEGAVFEKNVVFFLFLVVKRKSLG